MTRNGIVSRGAARDGPARSPARPGLGQDWLTAHLLAASCDCGASGPRTDRPGGLALTEVLLELAAFPAGGIVLDIGCGCGASVGLLLDHNQMAIGVDIDPGALAVARTVAGDAAYLRVSGDALPIPSGSVDGILAECCLSVMPDRRRALAEWRRVLKPRGTLALSDLYRREARGDDGDAGLATSAELEVELAGLGLEIVRFADCSQVLAPWMAERADRDVAAESLGYCLAVARRQNAALPGVPS